MTDVFKRLEKKRLIFTVTTGRSGTAYLAKIMAPLPGVASYHEPDPRFSDVMREIQTEKSLAREFWIERKLPQIAGEKRPIYVETSHLFCKGFLEPLLDLGIIPDLILLHRSFRKVALSMYHLGTVPARTEKGRRYYLSPDDRGVLRLPDWQGLHDYQLCYWYCLEIARRSETYQRMVSEFGGLFVKTTVQDISDLESYKNFLKRLRLPQPGFFYWFVYRRRREERVNRKTGKKQDVELTASILDSLEEEVLELIEKSGHSLTTL